MSNIKYSIILFIILVYLIYNHNPKLFKNPIHKYQNPIIVILLAILSYYLILVYNKKI